MRFLGFSRHGGFPLVLLAILLLIFTAGLKAAPAKKPRRWRYIVIHHSATRKGNAAIMDRYHSNHRRMQNGLAYHFVIGNGTCGCGDGEIEVGHRWKEQLPGGHVKQPWLNESGIGICLVGNFNRQTVSKKQMDALVKLVNRLRTTYGIPLSCIKGHGDFKGERTVCPGRNFPMKRLYERLKKGASSRSAGVSKPRPASKRGLAAKYPGARRKGASLDR